MINQVKKIFNNSIKEFVYFAILLVAFSLDVSFELINEVHANLLPERHTYYFQDVLLFAILSIFLCILVTYNILSRISPPKEKNDILPNIKPSLLAKFVNWVDSESSFNKQASKSYLLAVVLAYAIIISSIIYFVLTI